MGNIESALKELNTSNKNIISILNNVFMTLFHNLDEQELEQSSDEQYCESMQKHFSSFLNDVSDENIKNAYTLLYPNGEHQKKEQKCRQIAIFYMTLYKLFTTVVASVHPHSFKNDKLVYLLQRNVKSNDKNNDLEYRNLGMCMKNIQQFIFNKQDSGSYDIGYRCSENPPDILSNETGLPELEKLYYDKYDMDTNTFNGMSETMSTRYMNDVKQFYKAFTGNDATSDISSFSNISLQSACSVLQDTGKNYTINNPTSETNTNIEMYGKALENMIQQYQSKLDELYRSIIEIFILNPEDNSVSINNSMNMDKLNKKVDDVVAILSSMYSQCGENTNTVINNLKNVIDEITPDRTNNQMKSIQSKIDDSMYEP